MFKLLEVLTSTGMPVAENITDEISTTTTTLSPSAERISEIANKSEEVVNNVVESNPITSFIKEVVTSPQFYVPVVTIIAAFIIFRIAKKCIDKRVKKNASSITLKRRNTVYILAGNIIKYVVTLIAVIVCLSAWGLDVTSLLAGLGIAGAIAGLALQDALKDIISGISIIFENFFVIGDLVKYNDFEGHVIEFGLKSTKIQGYDGTVFIVSNRNIGEIKNLSYKDSNTFIELPVAYESNEEEVIRVIKEVLEKISEWKISTAKGEYLGVNNLNSSSVDYYVVVHSNSEDKFAIRRKALSEFKKAFDKNKIKIPYTQIEVYNHGKK
jgi:small conductance mechanosensitive channel